MSLNWNKVRCVVGRASENELALVLIGLLAQKDAARNRGVESVGRNTDCVMRERSSVLSRRRRKSY